MIVKFKGRDPVITGSLNIGNRGDVKATTLTFKIEKSQEELDLSTYIPSLEWLKSLGGQDIVELTSSTDSSDSDYININWALSKEIMELPGRGNICINFLSNDGDIVFRTSNLPIYVKDTINVDETLIPSIPESYRDFIKKVDENSEQIELNTNKIHALENPDKEEWIYPTLLNNALTLSTDPIKYKKDILGQTYIMGTIKNTDGSRACFQLVTGYRIYAEVSYFKTISKNGNILDTGMIDSDGMFYISVPDNDIAYVNLIFTNKEA